MRAKLSARWHNTSHWVRWTLLAFVLLLVAGRLSLPYFIKRYVNQQLAKSNGYHGGIGDVRVHLWRGAYVIHDITIIKEPTAIPAPLFEAREADLSIQWRELFHGSIVGEVRITEPRVNFVAGPTETQSQTGAENDWGQTLESLFPFKLNRLDVREGQVHFQNFHSTPPVDIAVTHLTASATNLTNTRDLKTLLPAGVHAQANAMGKGLLDLDLHFAPLVKAPTFELNAAFTNVDLTSLNDFLRAYGKFDVERGLFSVYTSVAAKEGSYEGYLKVFFENLDVFAWEKERKKNVLQIFWQAIVGSMAAVLKNQRTDTLAAKVPITGTYTQTNVGIWSAVSTLLQNAFIRALIPKLDQYMRAEEVPPRPEKKAKDKKHETPPGSSSSPEESRAAPPAPMRPVNGPGGG